MSLWLHWLGLRVSPGSPNVHACGSLLHVCILVCFCLGFVIGVFVVFFLNKKDVYIFGNDRNVVQIYFCLCCSTVVFF